ncbi:hypothetical protein [Rhizobium rhizogenes]|uniref:hypothetical protein n=1 Tax=Rhizobium rhizogenes TaxID=359 RepID=UPI0022BCFE83|nr:hypothetical protein [Rhizobium rhizogenes]MCZ7466399.1 hypothetical protein [Rhizobium rhizogenes]
MIEKQTLIRNPLTVIAVFAGIAETSGAACLPFLVPEVQETYVWFLILFPPFLVMLFFATLNCNHRVLYAPSDYQDERHFMGFNPAGPVQVMEKIQEQSLDAARAISEESGEPVSPPEVKADGPGDEQQGRNLHPLPIAAQAYLLEDFALSKVAKDFNLRLLRNQSPDGMRDTVFDAVSVEGGFTTVVEVMTAPAARSSLSVDRAFNNVLRYWERLPVEERNRFAFILAVAAKDELTEKVREQLYGKMRGVSSKYPFHHRLVVYDAHDLNMGVFG